MEKIHFWFSFHMALKVLLSFKKGNFPPRSITRAYEFLRRLEHAIQVYGCISTQSFSDSEIKRLAKGLNMKEEEFIKVYKEYTIGVSLIFSGIMP